MIYIYKSWYDRLSYNIYDDDDNKKFINLVSLYSNKNDVKCSIETINEILNWEIICLEDSYLTWHTFVSLDMTVDHMEGVIEYKVESIPYKEINSIQEIYSKPHYTDLNELVKTVNIALKDGRLINIVGKIEKFSGDSAFNKTRFEDLAEFANYLKTKIK